MMLLKDLTTLTQSPKLTLAQVFETLLARPAPVRFTAYDGSSYGPPDAAVGEAGPVLVGDDGSDNGRRAVRHAAVVAARVDRELIRMNVDDGDPVSVMSEAAAEKQSCLIVTGTRGRGPIRAELFGSVSTGLVQRSGRPVVLVSPNAGDAV